MHRFTRFEQTFDSKARAILKLDNTARDYGEIVAIRYKNEVKEVKTLLAFYQSTNKGDYTIMHDTAETKREDGKAKIFSVLRRPGESDKECIARDRHQALYRDGWKQIGTFFQETIFQFHYN